MSIVAMKVLSVAPHADADALRVHRFGLAEGDPVVVVGNLETTYEVGGVVAVARVGATLKDGTRIRKARLRGVDSFGMTLAKIDAAVGTDLSEQYGEPVAEVFGKEGVGRGSCSTRPPAWASISTIAVA